MIVTCFRLTGSNTYELMVNAMATEAIFKMGIRFYIGKILRTLLESGYGIHVNWAHQEN